MVDPAAPENPSEPPRAPSSAEAPASASASASASPSVLERVRAAPGTFALIAIDVAVFLWMSSHGGTDDMGTQLRFGANESIHVWAGEYWRVATYMFLHAGWLHILMNSYMAVGWSSSLERVLGLKRFLLVYGLAGIAGGCASAISSALFHRGYSVGASGALFGIIGSVLALRRRQLPSHAAFFADRAIRSLLVQIALWTAIGLTVLHLDNAAHFGGMVTGFVVTWVMTSRAPRVGWPMIAVAFGALFIFAARPWWRPEGADANRLLAFSQAYFTGKVVDEQGAHPWPKNPARATRFLTKGCGNGVAPACMLLADEVEQIGEPDATSKADALRARACDIDPGQCLQMH